MGQKRGFRTAQGRPRLFRRRAGTAARGASTSTPRRFRSPRIRPTIEEEQIAFALRQAETGTPVAEVVRKMGISEQTFYRWRKQYARMGLREIRRLKQLEEENRKRKQLVADLSLDKLM